MKRKSVVAVLSSSVAKINECLIKKCTEYKMSQDQNKNILTQEDQELFDNFEYILKEHSKWEVEMKKVKDENFKLVYENKRLKEQIKSECIEKELQRLFEKFLR